MDGVQEEREGYFVYSRREKVNGDVVWLGMIVWKRHELEDVRVEIEIVLQPYEQA